MPVRASFAVVAVVVGTVLVVGCAQTSSPTSPSSSASSSVSGTASVTPQSTSNFAPVLAQLNRVDNFLVSANHQLNLCLAPPALGHPPGPCDQNSLDFYLKANAALDGVAVSIPPGPPGAPATDALNAIIEQANLTLGLLVNIPPGPPGFPQIIIEAQHTIEVATSLKSCTTDVCTTL